MGARAPDRSNVCHARPATIIQHVTQQAENARMTTPAERCDALLQNQRAINRNTLQRTSSPNTVYACEFKKFHDWVHSQEDLAHVPLFSRQNVAHCFLRVVAYKPGKPENGRKVVNALQWYCKFRYNDSFVVDDSVDVLAALRLQKARGESTGNPGGDPLRGLKDAVPESDRILIMNYSYRNRTDWDTACVNYSWGYQGAIRGASNHALVFSDLNMSNGFGPEKSGSLARALLVVLRKGDLHKDRHEKDQQVCAWRHKQYVLCAVFATACRVLKTLRTMGDSINFYQRNKRERAAWWDIPLIDWDEYNGKCSTCFSFALMARGSNVLWFLALRNIGCYQGDLQKNWGNLQ
jgi:hypothetical protein